MSREVCFALGLALIDGVGSARAEVRVIEEERSYILDASTLDEMADQLARYRAQSSRDDATRSHGLTEAGIQTHYKLDPSETGDCALRDLRVEVHLTRTLPRWKPASPPKPEMIEIVTGMLRGLAAHEEGHRRHVLASAATIDAKLAALSLASDCIQAQRAAERIVSRALIRLQVHEMNYDLATDKGRKQGAFLRFERTSPERPLRRSML